jgi:ribosomal protein S9
VEAREAEGVGPELRRRIARLRALSSAYRALSAGSGPEPVHSRRVALGYYQQLGRAHRADTDARAFGAVEAGEADVFDYFARSFAPPYARLPRLPPLEEIYGRSGAGGAAAPDAKAAGEDDARRLRRDAAAAVAQEAEPAPARPRTDAAGWARAVGRRKTSVAVARVRPGAGTVRVNGRPLDAAFPDVRLRRHALRPALLTDTVGAVDVLARVSGGGASGQAQAVGHAIARALRRLLPSTKAPLKAAQLLRRDPRSVERKKPGRPKARKGFTWVKR